jgi:hypothetical protein
MKVYKPPGEFEAVLGIVLEIQLKKFNINSAQTLRKNQYPIFVFI